MDAAAPETQAPLEAGPLLRELWGWTRPHRRYVVVVLLLLVVATPVTLAAPLIMRRVVDDAVASAPGTTLLFWGLVLGGLTLAQGLLDLGVGYSTTRFHTAALRDLRQRLYLHVQALSARYLRDQPTGALLSRQVDDVGNISGALADRFARAAIDALRALGYVAMCFYVEWRMATGALVFASVIFGFEYAISGALRRRSLEVREAWTGVLRTIHEGISGHALIQATAAEGEEARRFSGDLSTSVRATLRRDLFSLWTNQVFRIIGGISPTVIILCGIYLISEDEFTVGGLFAYLMYLTHMFGAFNRLAEFNPGLQSSLASLQRIHELLATPVEISSPTRPKRPPIIEGRVDFDGVAFSYRPDSPVLEDITASLPQRSMVALVGPSGAGKTTLAHLVLRFFDPTRGRVLIDGVDLRELDLAHFRRHLGLVPQDVFLFARTVRENLAFGAPDSSEEDIRRAAEAASALEFIESLPDGFDTLVGERGVKLSGGQRQRLAIAREILRDPRILILDEATSSLDSETEAAIQRGMTTLLANRTSLVIAHRLSTVLRADEILVLDSGSIVERGRHDDLLRQGGLYARLYRLQLEHQKETVQETDDAAMRRARRHSPP